MNRLVVGFICALSLVNQALAQETFRVELGRDGETIGDMRPVFLKFESRPLPAISPAEVARRYQRLFRTSDEPEVRVDALNRLTNIRDQSGQDIGFSVAEEEGIYHQVIDSYESILARGSFSGRLDELLYQMAKAHALTGQTEASIDRLRQLVGLYPKSAFVPEARFRIAESAFSAGEFAEAESGYQALIGSEGIDGLEAKARYMLGWSQFKQGAPAWDRAGKTFLSVLDEFLPTQESLADVNESNVDAIDDTFRVLALMAARRNGAETLLSWLGDAPARHWEYLVFDRLADYYAINGEFNASVAVNRAFVRYAPGHSENPGFMAQIADVWSRAGSQDQLRGAKADYIAMFGSASEYAVLDESDQARWQLFSRQLGDYHYNRAFIASEQGSRSSAVNAFSLAGDYYEALAERLEKDGAVLRLAGDARLQAGQYGAALADFRSAAYETDEYSEASDAGWAAVALLRDGVDGAKQKEGFAPDLTAFSTEADRFASRFPEDTRLPGLMADLATRWFSSDNGALALEYGQKAIGNDRASSSERYAGWIVTAKVRQRRGEFGLAERAWKQALDFIETGTVEDLESDAKDSVLQQLATVIYRQGEQDAEAGRVDASVSHFRRIEAVLPGSAIAVQGRFDAANTLLKASELVAAIDELKQFRNDFPEHPLTGRVSDKLVYAYVSSAQPVRAASELLNASIGAADPWPARLRAAALFHQTGEIKRRNQLYLDYLATNPVPQTAEQHIRLQTMRHRLVESDNEPASWRKALVASELASQWHSEHTLSWAARNSLALGARAAATFSSVELIQPLNESLDRKQKALETARQRFLDAETLGGEAVRSESLYRRAELYRLLARDLMTSSVPGDLNELERMQYQMLLEEEAFPFEEKAIRLHSENHRRITSQGFDAWVSKSLAVLAELNPGRYNRSVRWMSWNREANDGA
ncbi:outer membrane protein assembly factor BamD [Marinobacter sediminum]|uniref:tetratricopeptide repeat protein n=1 Tax=Marinobacter sediminum TaxID=256323 RepID=UPI00202DBB8C|nr:tetratricopeptide repeat protein [Marinobacter sediminum]MCM0611860.1 outer membrane protein assembly factor BamD [Marinobacter sediminum]